MLRQDLPALDLRELLSEERHAPLDLLRCYRTQIGRWQRCVEELASRLLSRLVSPEDARRSMRILGDAAPAEPAIRAVAVMTTEAEANRRVGELTAAVSFGKPRKSWGGFPSGLGREEGRGLDGLGRWAQLEH